ncbi:uncharacterized protein LOC131973047 [Centropristis striata]|uniref:uncharacterized protein LOC131973047 n=1 Tax=Centropristis striata TaxID=184440 RepID=UPI0027DFBA4F|nr:uncharacterized protein LOC131973047 [Centropristis striata]
MAKGIQTVHPLCSLAFKRHRVKSIGSSRSGPVFVCSGCCVFDDCPVEVDIVVPEESSLKALVTFRGSFVCHRWDQVKRRPVRGNERDALSQILATKMPRSVFLDSIEKVDDIVMSSGCRDQVPATGVMKTLSWSEKKKRRRHKNEFLSLLRMLKEEEDDPENRVLQKISLHPKGVMLFSSKTLNVVFERRKEDIVYIDATGSIVVKGKGQTAPFYVYEVVVRHPSKGSSPLPVATFVTSDHTTTSISYFLGSVVTGLMKQHGPKAKTRPVMFICDGSVVLLQSLTINFCGVSLQELLTRYYMIVSGQAKEDAISLPIIHRCLSHVMKNAKELCKKHATKHYKLAMHVFGCMTQASTLRELDELVLSTNVVFSSSHSGDNVSKHFENIQMLLTKNRPCPEDSSLTSQGYENDVGPTPFQQHFEEVIGRENLDQEGDENTYFSPTFIPTLMRYFLPQAALWCGLLLGDLGRHGTGPVYDSLSKKYRKAASKSTQNYTQDNNTQGIMEKSQWDLKQIRFQRKKMARLDDFVDAFKVTLKALLREYADSKRRKKKVVTLWL